MSQALRAAMTMDTKRMGVSVCLWAEISGPMNSSYVASKCGPHRHTLLQMVSKNLCGMRFLPLQVHFGGKNLSPPIVMNRFIYDIKLVYNFSSAFIILKQFSKSEGASSFLAKDKEWYEKLSIWDKIQTWEEDHPNLNWYAALEY